MKTFLKVSVTVLALVGLIGFTAITNENADPGTGKPTDPPDSIVETQL